MSGVEYKNISNFQFSLSTTRAFGRKIANILPELTCQTESYLTLIVAAEIS